MRASNTRFLPLYEGAMKSDFWSIGKSLLCKNSSTILIWIAMKFWAPGDPVKCCWCCMKCVAVETIELCSHGHHLYIAVTSTCVVMET